MGYPDDSEENEDALHLESVGIMAVQRYCRRRQGRLVSENLHADDYAISAASRHHLGQNVGYLSSACGRYGADPAFLVTRLDSVASLASPAIQIHHYDG